MRGAAYALPGPLERVVTSLTPASGTVLARTLPSRGGGVGDALTAAAEAARAADPRAGAAVARARATNAQEDYGLASSPSWS